ncbi:ZFP36L [Lepeophtheirus salmonis]|uniref:ZFP36L n=1 Tax=Lepeophtheirus salmonis TaxID=72036 RepID=A0A7R8CPM6_LEPSM|nr:ZFP36L [Lepeophtheirus salmonis]CAF2885506.1 ZFP36L [Lepeophtheirus salmonis]
MFGKVDSPSSDSSCLIGDGIIGLRNSFNNKNKLTSSSSSTCSSSSSASSSSSSKVNTSRYKTELCRPFQESGTCKYGEKCQFAHGSGEVKNITRHPKYKTDLCKTYHSIGFCPYGPRCHFIHNLNEMNKKCYK